MKKLYTLTLLIASSVGFAQATLPYYEPFNYAEASNINGQGGWAGAAATPDDAIVAGGNLSYSGLAPSSGNMLLIQGNGFDPQQTFTDQTSGMVYSSFIFNVTDLSTLTDPAGGYFYGLASTTTNFASTVWLKANGTGFQIGINKATAVADTQFLPTVYNVNTEYFVVIAYDLGAVKSSSIWVNPVPASLGLATAPTADLNTTTGTTDRTNIKIVFVRQDSVTETPNILVDEVRVGTSWAEVTPTGPMAVHQNDIAGLRIFPNPVTNGNLFINSDNNETKTVSIYDVLGKKVITATVNDQPVNVSALNSGVYIVKVIEAGKTATRKLVIK